MKVRKLFWMITLTSLLLMLAACAGNSPAPTAESGSSGTEALTKQATFEGGILGAGSAFSVQYPDSWSHQLGESDIRLSNNAELISLENAAGTLPTGAIAMSVSLTPASDIQGSDVASLVQTFVDFAQASPSSPEYGEIETITLAGHDGAKAMGTIAGSDNMILAVGLDGNMVLAIIVAPEGELLGHMDTINAILASATLSPAE